MKTLNFDMNALRTMVIGVDLGGFSHAALRLNRSPSAVSMQLRKLERQAGQRLFQRSGRGLVLTQAGELLLRHARRVLALNDEMGQALGAINDRGTVALGFPGLRRFNSSKSVIAVRKGAPSDARGPPANASHPRRLRYSIRHRFLL